MPCKNNIYFTRRHKGLDVGEKDECLMPTVDQNFKYSAAVSQLYVFSQLSDRTPNNFYNFDQRWVEGAVLIQSKSS